MSEGTMQKQNRERQMFLDILRVMATCAVVLLHTVTGVMDRVDMAGYPMEKTVFLVLMDLVTWCVPIFVMISGYLFLQPDRELSWQKMFVKYCKRILLALFVFGVPYALLEMIAVDRTFRISMLFQSVWMVCIGKSWSHMWYLYLILVLYLMTPLLRMVLKKLPVPVLYLILLVLFVGSSVLPFLQKLYAQAPWAGKLFAFPDYGIYLFYYLCGYVVFCGKKSKGERKGIFTAALVGILLLCAGLIASRLIGDYHLQMAYNYPFTVVLSLLLMVAFANAQLSEASKGADLLKAGSDLCFGIYLIHPVFLNIFYKFLGWTPLSFYIGVSLPVFFVGVLALAFIGAWILRKIPAIKKYVL